ncbi:KpsF/GutQ family sugar-phosphate isomerase [Novosphingobium sp. 1949]|uniref:KpsF/GutQ family sugar-phosphate isomerase n=1 Tax=Novosphingobium organovorum TaxID=2930092 RepID=A0ABT0BIU0_9SPHN|nr:KpsF/GutQ family sugar-phosphate isomerase [Novosphingobium organovorum]MCJ2184883.1 KpsF/GutQ family sugar-phosphate isomerase [Novosphingobium organovorum]
MKNNVARTGHTLSTLRTLDIEMEGLQALKDALSRPELSLAVERAIQTITATQGRVVITGMGKSGHVARKIAATMRSTGTSALYLHPGEASHGDLGVISREDVVLAITWSGETNELSDIFHYCHTMGVTLIVATAQANSTAARAADICLVMPTVREACPNRLAPTSSTTLQLVLGDALAVALTEARGFTSSDFRAFHPGGTLGNQLATVGDVMGSGDAIPRVPSHATLTEATIEMNRKRYGCTAVVDAAGHLVGAFTDGDLRRCITVHPLSDTIAQHMSPKPVTTTADTLCSEALGIMNECAVSVLFVTQGERLAGIIHMHDIVKLGVERR